MRTSKRIENKDGFYMSTINSGVTQCHAIFIYRETRANGQTTFYMYDPNGRTNAVKYDYQKQLFLMNLLKLILV
jgi:hypothetical protein